jgi:GNAT superfamily N-acetyltransferase
MGVMGTEELGDDARGSGIRSANPSHERATRTRKDMTVSAYTAGDGAKAIERTFGLGEPPVGSDRIELATHRERPIPPAALRTLYDHVAWVRPATEAELGAVLAAGPAVGAWNGEELVGFVRALSDGHLAAYIEDVMVHERCRHLGVGSVLMTRLLQELDGVAVVTLFCAPGTAPFYQQQGFQPSESVILQRDRRHELS